MEEFPSRNSAEKLGRKLNSRGHRCGKYSRKTFAWLVNRRLEINFNFPREGERKEWKGSREVNGQLTRRRSKFREARANIRLVFPRGFPPPPSTSYEGITSVCGRRAGGDRRNESCSEELEDRSVGERKQISPRRLTVSPLPLPSRPR